MFGWLKDTNSEHDEFRSKILPNNSLININTNDETLSKNIGSERIKYDKNITIIGPFGRRWDIKYEYIKKSPICNDMICKSTFNGKIMIFARSENIQYFLEYLCELRTMKDIPKSCSAIFKTTGVPYDINLMYDDNLKERMSNDKFADRLCKIEESLGNIVQCVENFEQRLCNFEGMLERYLLTDFCGKENCKNKVHKGKWCKNHVCSHELCDEYVSPLNMFCELHCGDNRI